MRDFIECSLQRFNDGSPLALTARYGRGYLPTLDGWRAIAVSLVMARHYLLGHQCLDAGAPNWCGNVTALGMKGVSLFFAISGFLICSRLLEERSERGVISLRAFYIRRAWRILPPALVYLAVIAVLAGFGIIAVSMREWIAALTFWRDYGITGAYGWFTAHYWSLSVEEKFYLMWPLLLTLLGSRRALRTGLAIAALVAVWRISDGHWLITKRAFGIPVASLAFRWDTRLDALLYGALLAIVLDDPQRRKWVLAHCNQAVQLVCLLVVAGLFASSRIATHVEPILEAIALPMLVASTVLAPRTYLGRLLESPTFVWVGKLSYSLYLWQQLFLTEVEYQSGFLHRGPLALTCILVCAVISYYAIERPSVRLGHRYAPPVTPGRPATTTSRHRSEGELMLGAAQ
jgi:peptidoglycan/LPS O-acetylase OafA/YrhL